MLFTAKKDCQLSNSNPYNASSGDSEKHTRINYAIGIGRVGGLAVAFGIGTAVAFGTAALACADSGGSDTSGSSASSASGPAAAGPSAAGRHAQARRSSVVSAGKSVPAVQAHSVGSESAANNALTDSRAAVPARSAAAMTRRGTSTYSMQTAIASALLGWKTGRDSQPSSLTPVPTPSEPAPAQPAPTAVPALETVQIAAVTTTAPPFFAAADWLWKPIPANPALAANNATWVKYLSAPGTQHVANVVEYGVTLIPASAVTSSTPRYRVKFTELWGPNPFGSYSVPLPRGTAIPPGSDGHVAVLDPATGKAFGIWQAKYNARRNIWSGSWGGITDLNGNGVDVLGTTSTGSNIARYAGVITAAEFDTAVKANTAINHALVFSTDIAGPGFVGPAAKSDGANIARVATPIPEGYRIQLDPSINVDAITGITPAERVIAKTLQTYGAYVIDNGGARAAFMFEMIPGATAGKPGAVWTSAGLTWDYYDMAKIPWSKLRVLAA